MDKKIVSFLAAGSSIFLASCNDRTAPAVDVTAAPYECLSAKITVGTNAIDTVVRFNKVTGEAQLLNAASFASKATGAQGNVIGWVPLGDLRDAVQELLQREQAAQQQAGVAAPPAAPAATATPATKKKD